MSHLSRTLPVLLAIALAAGATPVAAAPDASPRPGVTRHISQAHDGGPGDEMSNASAISANGRFVAFHSYARNLLPDFPQISRPQVFVRDLLTGEVEWVSMAHDGGAPTSYAQVPEISADGRHVLFSSRSTNLTPEEIPVGTHQFVHDRQTGVTDLVTRAPDGTPANAPSQNASISGDGRFVAFGSRATNLADGAVDTHLNCFVHDRETGTTDLVSVSSSGETGNYFCWYPSLSHDGRFVAFHSQATNLVEGAGGGLSDSVFVHDRETSQTEVASLTWDGQRPNSASVRATISGDGRYVAFGSYATNMTPAQEPVLFPYDVYVRDRQARTTERVSVSTAGVQGDGSSYVPRISAGGRYVLFTSLATNLDHLPRTHAREAILRDRLLHRTERVSVGSAGQVGNGTNAFPGSVSADGRFADFWTDATNLAPHTDNEHQDVFVRDRGADLGVVGASVTRSGPSARVRGGAVFAGEEISQARPGQLLVQDSGLEMHRASVLYHPHEAHLLFRSSLNGMRSARQDPLPGMEYGWAFSTPAGAFEIRITQRPGSAANLPLDPTRTAVELFRCTSACERIAELDGSVGVVGPVAVAALPLDAIGLEEGDRLTGIRAFIDLGDRQLGQTATAFELRLPSTDVPVRSVRLGTAAEGSPGHEVVFGAPVELREGRFDEALDAGDDPVWARTCLGQRCTVERLG